MRAVCTGSPTLAYRSQPRAWLVPRAAEWVRMQGGKGVATGAESAGSRLNRKGGGQRPAERMQAPTALVMAWMCTR